VVRVVVAVRTGKNNNAESHLVSAHLDLLDFEGEVFHHRIRQQLAADILGDSLRISLRLRFDLHFDVFAHADPLDGADAKRPDGMFDRLPLRVEDRWAERDADL
jgi:hypothetical protein